MKKITTKLKLQSNELIKQYEVDEKMIRQPL